MNIQTLVRVCAFFTVAAISSAASITLDVFTTTPAGVNSNGTIGFAFAGDMFVGTIYNSGLNTLYSTDLNGGNQQVFAPGVSIPGGFEQEHFIASSAGLGGFPSNDLYVGVDGGIVHINHGGTTSDMFVTGLDGYARNILFDDVGTFGHDMLVSTSSGKLYRVNSAGVATYVTDLGEDVEGMDIAPLSYAVHPGELFVGAENSGNISAVKPDGTMTLLANVPWTEMLSFIPTFGMLPGEGFYSANFRPNILYASSGQFAGYIGDILVTSEYGNHEMTVLHWNGSSFDSTVIGNFPNTPEDGFFLNDSMLGPTGGNIPEPGTIFLAAAGLAACVALRRRRKA